jgi:ABC-type transport system involved in multi-copper enzyme maturation permease subunit
MTLPAAINVLRWLVWDTFCQSLASRIFWVMLCVSVLAIVFCLGVGVTGGKVEADPGEKPEFIRKEMVTDIEMARKSGVNFIEGDLTLGFGMVRVPHARSAEDSIHFLQLTLCSFVAGTLGMLLTLVWTAGFLPSFLEANSASVLLTKPAPRWLLVMGKFLGMVAFVGLQAAIFVGGTWLVLGFRTGVWNEVYLFSIPLLMIEFAFFYSFSMFLAVATRSTAVCIIGTILFWLVCMAINIGRIEMVMQPDAYPLLRWPLEVAYWILPKPIDFNLAMSQALNAQSYFVQWPALVELQRQGRFLPEMAFLTSTLFAGAMAAASAMDVGKVDY